ncbi:spermidine/putrescine ABC transporter ATP-binding protein [Aestuariivirga litoralis]|uniref:Spermidine/putrescine ABC transporter ATP-binding protein n=1 Tax=Aestuariivirga litoralis TaxID=2650924 RepID=A0A2W2CFL7_9HYPH|nr:ABC transporter ATP-binding protein [Aestuariivirga litoralis]PZF78923.1 spermidine/putrescine ABC transporter ATP-binding protein [Aestuariivirga litoralis]
MSFIQLNGLAKQFGPTRVVNDFSLSIPKGAFVSLLGPSGCGKTTVLRMLAGLEQPSAGSITIDGKDVTTLKANQRQIGMVFQAYALFPNLTVAENVAFGLRVAGRPRTEIDRRVAEMLELIGLPDLGARYPFQLSGGQQQRVALARAIAPRPRVLLLDEPLSALDAKIRVSLRSEIRAIQRELGITTVFVTHDQEEALSISDQVVVMYKGIAEQAGTPFEIYNAPKTSFVATFVGTLNVLQGEVEDGAAGTVRVGEARLPLAAPIAAAKGARVALAVRPESVRLKGAETCDIEVPADIQDVSFLGSVIRIRAAMLGTRVEFDMFNQPDMPPPAPGSRVTVGLNSRDLLLLAD